VWPRRLINWSNCHPAPFPIEIARDHILSWSNECDLIFDPFGGSGTTAIAAENTNRKWVCCEISEEYTTKAVERILNHQREDDGN
jgi:site-specific DNA-methyltransferase (adenine-specific)